MDLYKILGLFLNLFSICCASTSYPHVTCGSVIKLYNSNYKIRLHSHDIKYGSGSGQQSVTGTEATEDVNSHWVIKGKKGETCKRGEPIACDQQMRLEHLITKKNLHSHLFSSPLSSNQEVSAFGDDGEGDSGDHWTLTCSSEFWNRDSLVRFKHVDTGAWLSVSGHTYGRPINGQMEVNAIIYSDNSCYWKTEEGIYIKPSDSTSKSEDHIHTEL